MSRWRKQLKTNTINKIKKQFGEIILKHIPSWCNLLYWRPRLGATFFIEESLNLEFVEQKNGRDLVLGVGVLKFGISPRKGFRMHMTRRGYSCSCACSCFCMCMFWNSLDATVRINAKRAGGPFHFHQIRTEPCQGTNACSCKLLCLHSTFETHNLRNECGRVVLASSETDVTASSHVHVHVFVVHQLGRQPPPPVPLCALTSFANNFPSRNFPTAPELTKMGSCASRYEWRLWVRHFRHAYLSHAYDHNEGSQLICVRCNMLAPLSLVLGEEAWSHQFW